MKYLYLPQDQVYWYHHRLPAIKPINDLSVDVAIIGGGMAGLSAAQAFMHRGKKVALIEQYYCGSGATGKSSGFITPNAELSLTDFAHHFDVKIAQCIWDLITSGVEDIRENIKTNDFGCDYTEQNTLVVANSKHALNELEVEHNNLIKLGYKSAFYDASNVRNHINSNQYFGGVGYEDSFGMNPFLYCQEMKKLLHKNGALIYEETPVIEINDHKVITTHGSVNADHIIVCADRFIPQLGFLKKQIYHAQTFLMVSERLSDKQISIMFPDDKLMVWDTDLIYTYFRVTGDNRLLLGGGNLFNTYATSEYHNNIRMTEQLTRYLDNKFPDLKINFLQQWPGLIGISKDLMPIAGRDHDKTHIYFISAAAGLPIAAALGRYSAEHILDNRNDLDDYFSPYRSFPIGSMLQSLLGTKLSFALSNAITKYF